MRLRECLEGLWQPYWAPEAASMEQTAAAAAGEQLRSSSCAAVAVAVFDPGPGLPPGAALMVVVINPASRN